MQERGRMQEGMIADITIFNPDTIAETATYMAGMRGSYTKGIPHVLVSGQLIIEDGVANTKLRAGQPIRYPLIEKGEIDLDLGDKPFQWHSDLKEGDFAPTNTPVPAAPKDVESAADASASLRLQAAKFAAAEAWGNGTPLDRYDPLFVPCLDLCCASGAAYPVNHPKLRPFAKQLLQRRMLQQN